MVVVGLFVGGLGFAAGAALFKEPVSADASAPSAAPSSVFTQAPADSGVVTPSPAESTSPVAPDSAPTVEPVDMTADGTCISTACADTFKKSFKMLAESASAATIDSYFEYAKNMCDALSEGDQAVDLRDSAVRYNGQTESSFLYTFASATEPGSLCPAYKDQVVQLR
ncbi:hypothetical protein [Actinoplanes sp. NPDC051411]|uniref:hypothetical protein n=1 Tax=Actinoplanes sp. NPDC051411 TaxID=3155522 RepID=UPI0034223356